MSKIAVQVWSDQVEKLIRWAEKYKKSDHKWRVRTWDEENTIHGILECLECHSAQGKSQGSEDKMAIVNLFLNFRTKHLNSEKHKANWCRRRNLDVSSVVSKTTPADIDHRAETNLGLEIVQRINDEEESERMKLFVVEGDVNREPCYSWIYRVRCVLCGNKFELVPAKRNLEHNLWQHLCSEKHRERTEGEPSVKGGIRTGGKGRPKKSDPRDMKRQRCIEAFFGGSQRATNDSEGPSMSLSSRLSFPDSENTEGDAHITPTLSLLCWGYWFSIVVYNGKSYDVKAMVNDQKPGGAWSCEPRTKNFAEVSKILEASKRYYGIVGDVPVFFAEDETRIKPRVRWESRRDALTGFCGLKEVHTQCRLGMEVIVGSGEEGYFRIVDSFESNGVGSYARVIIVNLLHEDLPRLVVSASVTCNSFVASWVREQWEWMKREWEKQCRLTVGPIIGYASDGDNRRRKLMLADYSSKS
ncbi:hypothetical protein R1sor_012480 [Riccia sorocarpa]|uniref:Uncharacterized protein n=1 Tax=Riccia sorocarpa TaxID=122646 RepID=A0ABD3IA37_9MARC